MDHFKYLLLAVAGVLVAILGLQAFQNRMIENEDTGKYVYLTFDDGPSGMSRRILQILDNYEVPATFFVVGKMIPGQEETLRKMVAAGHAVGNHSRTHNVGKIYKSWPALEKEVRETEELITNAVDSGFVRVFRPPGGSRPRLRQSLKDELHAAGYKIYDWNCSAEDAVNPALPSWKIIENITKSAASDENRLIILMHDADKNTGLPEALKKVIVHFNRRGFIFKKLDRGTEELFM